MLDEDVRSGLLPRSDVGECRVSETGGEDEDDDDEDVRVAGHR